MEVGHEWALEWAWEKLEEGYKVGLVVGSYWMGLLDVGPDVAAESYWMDLLGVGLGSTRSSGGFSIQH